MPLSKLYEKPRSAAKVRSFPVKVTTMDAEMKFDDIEVWAISHFSPVTGLCIKCIKHQTKNVQSTVQNTTVNMPKNVHYSAFYS